MRDGRAFKVDQTNKLLYLSGRRPRRDCGGRPNRITDAMFMAAAKALAAMSPARNDPKGNLLPPVTELREISIAVARAVAVQRSRKVLTPDIADDEIDAAIAAKMWTPRYLPYRRGT
jgi:malate dehydrogenase (oxaloacetate-decarboxylating)